MDTLEKRILTSNPMFGYDYADDKIVISDNPRHTFLYWCGGGFILLGWCSFLFEEFDTVFNSFTYHSFRVT